MGHSTQTFPRGGSCRKEEVGEGHSLAQDDLRSTLAVHAVAAAGLLDDGAHGLAHGVEGVHLVQLLLRHLGAHRLVVLLQVQHEAQQAALCLVAHLTGQGALLFRGLRGEAEVQGLPEAPRGAAGGGARPSLPPPVPTSLCVPDPLWDLDEGNLARSAF